MHAKSGFRVAIAIVCLLGSGCTGSPPAGMPDGSAAQHRASSNNDVPQVVRIGTYLGSPPGVLPILADQKGYFKQAGVEVQLTTLGGPQDGMIPVATGQLDAAIAGLSAATFAGIERGLDATVVATLGHQSATDEPALVVRKDLLDNGQVARMADLRGRKIAAWGGPGSAAAFLVARALREEGQSVTGVELVNLTFPDTVAALKNGAIDAAYLPPPFSTEAAAQGSASPFGKTRTSGFQTVGVLYSGRLIVERPAAARAVMLGLVRAARELSGEHFAQPENLAILSAHMRVPVPDLLASGALDFDRDLRPESDTLLDMQRVFMDVRALAYQAPLPFERLADPSFSTYAAEVPGTNTP